MLSFLKKHPFAVEAYFERSIVLTFAVEKEQLAPLIPSCLLLDTWKDKWAFLAVALVHTKNLRPKGFPSFMGSHFLLLGYRIFVRYNTKAGKQLRGLYILKSETNKKSMEILGNIFTQYQYYTTDLKLTGENNSFHFFSKNSDVNVEFQQGKELVDLPTGSPFNNWKEARRFAGPLPFTFSVNRKTNEVLIIEGVRNNWIPTPLQINNYRFGFLSQLNLKAPVLASAFEVDNVPYYWKKGKLEVWK
ncbi:MAG: hypothetical protein RL115_2008 [Bacteroidota bacterium]|jgi:uncharacterized protein YqjF (DUF2071 family)